MTTEVKRYLDKLNEEYYKLHKTYEELFWVSYTVDHSVDKKMEKALVARDSFRTNVKHPETLKKLLNTSDEVTKGRIDMWLKFFERYQTPQGAIPLKKKAAQLESKIHKNISKRKEGYIDPYTKKFVPTSYLKIRTLMRTHDDEKIRKACYQASEKLATQNIKDYINLVEVRNQYAQKLGYEDFYDFKVQREDGMTKKELFDIFDSIYKSTKYAFKDIRNLEKAIPGLRKPWNFSYLIAGDFTKEEDPYFQFEEAVSRWGRSFDALGIDFQKGTLQLDLLDRKGKYNNGFCHWPLLVYYKDGKRLPGQANFTCNVVAGQGGSGAGGYNTLFHEGGHAAHLLNSEEREVALNHEYAPMSTSWAETQSMFLDTLFSSIEWRVRYAKNAQGRSYPFELFERKVKKLHPIKPTSLNGIIFVSNYEKEIYETKKLTEKKVLEIARRNHKKYFDQTTDSLLALNIPHIYSWEASGSYHGYGLAELALEQWREYFYKKYGYIVDNPKVGEEMAKVWKFAARFTFDEFVQMSTGKKLSAKPFLDNVTASIPMTLKRARKRVGRVKLVPMRKSPVKLNANISMVHGKKEIANNKKSFEDLAEKYKTWVQKEALKNQKN